MSDDDKLPAAKRAYKKWYETHRVEFNKKRRSRYVSDPDYRESVRSRHAPKSEPPLPGTMTLKEVATLLGKSVSAIHHWHTRGYLPPVRMHNYMRVYTLHQVELLKQLNEAMCIGRITDQAKLDRLEEVKARVLADWDAA